MSDHTVILSVTAFASEAAARQDFESVRRVREPGARGHVAAAVLHKGSDGALRVDLGAVVEPGVPWGGALLGAALTVLIAPVGIALLPPVVSAPADWNPVTSLVSHFWQHVPQETLRTMSEMLESNPAGIVIVAIDLTAQESRALISHGSATTVADSTTFDQDAAFRR